MEGGLDTLDKVEAGEVDADDALEFGVKIGDENADGLDIKEGGVDVVTGAVDVLFVGVDEENDKLGTADADAGEGKPVVEIGMSRTTLALGVWN